MGRPEADETRLFAMRALWAGLSAASHHEDALTVQEAEMAMMRHLGASENDLLEVQTNLAISYKELGRLDCALRNLRYVYSEYLKRKGNEHVSTLTAASNYANTLIELKKSREANSLLRKTLPVARRVLGESHDLTLRMMSSYAGSLFKNSATLGDLHKAVSMYEETERIARRVLGEFHPLVVHIERELPVSRALLAEALSGGA